MSYARPVYKGMNLGVTARYVYERFLYSVHALAFDVGLQFAPELSKDASRQPLRFGLTIANVGFSGRFAEQRTRLPSVLRAGASLDLLGLQSSDHVLIVASDVVKPFRENWRLNLGTEFGYQRTYFLRVGYQLGYDFRNISAGLGIRVARKINLDYSVTPFSDFFGVTHRITFNFEF